MGIQLLLGLGLCLAPADAPTPEVWMGGRQPWVLGQRPDQWAGLRPRVGGLTLFIDQVKTAELEDLRALVKVCGEAGVALGIECAGLCDWRAKEGDQAGELSFADEYRKVERLVTPVADGGAGGAIAYLQMDGPFRRMLYQKVGDVPAKTGYQTLDTAAIELIDAMRLWRDKLPELQFHLLTNFPNWGWGETPAYHAWAYTAEGPLGWGDYRKVLDLALERTKAADLPLTGLVVDNPYDYAIGAFRSNQLQVTAGVDWIQRIRELEDHIEAAGLQFSLILNSSRAGAEIGGSDQMYRDETLAYLDRYRAAGGTPTRWVVESWYPRPRAWLPESEPTSLTGLTATILEQVTSAD